MNNNKAIIVTGGSGLIGRAIIADLEANGFTALNLDIAFGTEKPENFECDITNEVSIAKTIETVFLKYPNTCGLVNNAYPRTKDWGKTTFEDTPTDSWQKNIDWQLNSYVYLTQQFIKQILGKNKASIVNIASIYGVVGNDFTLYEGSKTIPPAAYAAVKGGIINLTRHLASLYGKDGIRVNCVSPGGIFDFQDKSFVEAYENRVPLKRMGTPEDIAPPVRFLLSNDSIYITGHNLMVDGGWTAI